jgi:hypothetical protein
LSVLRVESDFDPLQSPRWNRTHCPISIFQRQKHDAFASLDEDLGFQVPLPAETLRGLPDRSGCSLATPSIEASAITGQPFRQLRELRSTNLPQKS